MSQAEIKQLHRIFLFNQTLEKQTDCAHLRKAWGETQYFSLHFW